MELASQAERLGYDVVFHQDDDDPEAPDPWTLLTWIAGRTESTGLVVPVAGEQLKLPAVLARSAISLDLLSNGRMNLVLGQGDEPADALDAAITIIREIMDVSQRGPVRSRSGYFTLDGAKRGPMPAHDIPIWVSAASPEMLRLAGQRADVWLAPFQQMREVDVQVASQYIDAAAREAGRDPREIRRAILVADPRVGELLPYVVEHGIGTFLLTSGESETIDVFANETMPALREAAQRELSEGLSISRLRRSDIREKRMPGIDYEGIPASLSDSVVEPGDVLYPGVRSTYMRGGSPGIVLQPRRTAEVVDALAYSRKHPDQPMSVRSAGHGISGRSTNKGGIVIDLSKMNAIEVLDESSRRVRLEPGARWMDVAATLQPYGWGLSSGDYGGVGVGGLATAGGIGWLGRKHGLTIDHLIAVEIVLADGSVVHASEDENADLFWAVRGAGANFGIVTSFEFEVYEVGNVGFGIFVLDASDTSSLLEQWGSIVESSPRDLTSFLMMGQPRPGQPAVAQVMSVVASDNPETIVDRLQPIANISSLYNQQVAIMPYASLMANAQGSYHDAVGEPAGRSGLIDHITPEFAAAADRLLQSGSVFFFQIRSVGGAVSDVPSEATTYANRSANFSVTAFGRKADQVNAAWDALSHHFNGLYLSFETDQRPERVNDAFPGETLQRLRELKEIYDPENVFRDNFNVAAKVAAE